LRISFAVTCRLSIIAVPLIAAAASSVRGPATSDLGLDSSDTRLVDAFNWAKKQALAFAFDGDPVGPWYEAALPGREAFCMRDVAHQAMGAHALGLARYTSNMLHRFAENISESRDWCSYWEIDRYNRPAPVDYKNDAQFWYCLPANYDVLDACYRMYIWTGDQSYLNDPVFLNFYNRTVNDYEQRWDLDASHIMKRRRFLNVKGEFDPQKAFVLFRGLPSYQESREDYVLGVDLLATQSAAYRAYAGIEDARRNEQAAHAYRVKAGAVRSLINNSWWDEKAGEFYSRLNKDYRLEGHDAAALLYRDAIEDTPRMKKTLDTLLDEIKKRPSTGVEGQSHQAEILYRYGKPDVAYAQMMDLARPGRNRREYPEVSYSVVGAIVTGLMGVTLDPASFTLSDTGGHFVDRFIRTEPGLGKIGWVELRNLPVRRNEVTVRHEAGRKTVFTNQKGPSLIWRASFPGSFQNLLLNGKPVKSRIDKNIFVSDVSSIDVPVAPGVTSTVEIPR
jgi:hypothetical protein